MPGMQQHKDMWTLGRTAADNPSLMKSFQHSSTVFELGRLAKWSTLGKAGTMVVNIAARFIPVPFVGGVVGKAAELTEGAARSYSHNKKITKYAGNAKKQAKFGWKELDVGMMDRYRKKIENTSKEIAKLSNTSGAVLVNAASEGQVCEGAFQIAWAVGYLERRCDKMQAAMNEITELINQTNTWIAETKRSAAQFKAAAGKDIEDYFKMGKPEHHAKCKPEHCAFNAQQWKMVSKQVQTARSMASLISREFFSPQAIIDGAIDTAEGATTEGEGWDTGNIWKA